MCGLVGFIGFSGIASDPRKVATDMADAIRHRGPDDHGIWTDDAAEVALAHRRLSIVDLSPAGHQPMHSKTGRFVVVFNGEIYNHVELKQHLEREGAAPVWSGHSDTEVLLAGLSAWGLEKTLERCVGMFAIAVFDREQRKLHLARDRAGEKPLYYGRFGRTFGFASELKALAQHPAFRGDIDRNSVALFMRYNNVPAPYSIFQGISKLPPGSFLSYDISTGRDTVSTYWSPRDVASRGLTNPFEGTADEALTHVERLIRQSLEGQMLADVPLGAFLSGGIDSSTIVALMQSISARPVKTYSIGFTSDAYNEAEHAKAVAQHLGTNHTEFYVTEKDALDVIPKLPSIYCEPFADSSQIPTYLVSSLARRHVTVALSGDGGDELFSGYTRYALAARVWPKLSPVPVGIRSLAAKGIRALAPGTWDAMARPVLGLSAWGRAQKRVGDKLHKASHVLAAGTSKALYSQLVSHWNEPDSVVVGATEPDALAWADTGSLMRSMMLSDLIGYLPNDILVKVDRAAMAVSLETRVPLLDHRLIEFSWTLPDHILRHGGQSKWPLRALLERYVPRNLTDRPKTGFGIPLDQWLRGELRDWAETLLSEKALVDGGFFEARPVRRAWDAHLSGNRNLHYQLWCVLMFQAWQKTWNEARS